MRRKVRGLRTIEQGVLREEAKNAVSDEQPPLAVPPPAAATSEPSAATLIAEVSTGDLKVAGAGAEGVGRSTIESFVYSFVLILILDYFVTRFLLYFEK